MSTGKIDAAKWRFALADARKMPLPPGRRSAAVFSHGTLDVRHYAPRGTDPQTPHDRDEVYVVERGTGVFEVAGSRVAFGPDDVLFVPAGVDHRFVDFSDDFETWVIFYGPKGGEA
ncbi:MAG: cupin domain-containing protein [Alphaproteobacteria bacterium]|nr:cupin domain-containing protein [Alphaproteobacteria bacterium]